MLNRLYAHNHPWLWRPFLLWLTLSALLVGGCGTEQPRLYRVGILQGGGSFVEITDGFKKAMTDLGYIEGQNIVYIVQQTTNDLTKNETMLQELANEQVDIIFAFPTESAVMAKASTSGTDIPVVFAVAGIEDNDLVESVRQPGGNITGVRFPGPDLTVKRFEILRELTPEIERLYLLYNPAYPNNPPALAALRPVAEAKGVELVETPVANLEEIEAALQEQAEDDRGIDAIQLLPEPMTHSPDAWAAILAFSEEQQVPLIGSMLSSAERGGIFSYSVDFAEVGELSAPIADKVLKGTPAGTIPVLTPEAHLLLNYRVAQELGLTIPEGLLRQADEVIR